MAYTGNLVRLAQKPDALKLPAPSPRHGVREGAPELQRVQQSVPSGTGSEFQGTDFDKVVMSGGGMPLDVQPSAAGIPPGTADPDAPYHITYTKGSPYDSTAILSARGAAVASGGAGDTVGTEWARDSGARTRAHEGIQERSWLRALFWPDPLFAEQQPRQEINPDGPRSSVEGPGGQGGMKYGRGINSLGQNNPDGFRNGRYRFGTWPNRVFAQIHRTIGTQYIQPRDIYTPGPQQRMVASMITPPALPQDPPNPDDAITANTSYASSTTSVFGGF
jgi:hypothetical protein